MAASDTERSWAEIDGSALRNNLRVVRETVGDQVKIISVVKADAYGHSVKLALPALRDGSDLFAVANFTEAAELRELGCDKPVLLLGPSLPAEYRAVAEAKFLPTISSAEEAEAFQKCTSIKGKPIHFAVDNGMGRVGAWIETATEEIERVTKMPGISVQSISTHLPSADEDAVFTKMQLEEFRKFSEGIKEQHPLIAFHALNSAGVERFADYAFDMVRPGLMLYGATSSTEFKTRLQPALTWKARVTLLRDLQAGRSISYGRTYMTTRPLRAATLPVGYADGYPRQLSGQNAFVILEGKRCPLLGRVTMDQIVVDASGTNAKCGDAAVLIGSEGMESVRAEELAEKAHTIPWHIFTGIGKRVRRTVSR